MNEPDVPMFEQNESLPNMYDANSYSTQTSLQLAQEGRDHLHSTLSRIYGLLVDIQVLTFVNDDSAAQARMASDPQFATNSAINDHHRATNIENYRVTIESSVRQLKSIVQELHIRESINGSMSEEDYSDENRVLIAERDRLQQQANENKQDMRELLNHCRSLQSQLVLLDVDDGNDDEAFD